MDQINANLDRISELSDDELKSLEGSIVSEFEAVQSQDLTPDVVEGMKALARAAVAVRSEVAQREAQAKQLAMEAAEAAEAIKGIDPDMDGDVDSVLDSETENDADDDANGDGVGDDAVSDGADHGSVAEAIEGIADVDNNDEASDEAPQEQPSDEAAPAAADDAQMADEAPAPGTDADPAPAAPDKETPSSDEDPAQGGTDTPEQGDLTDEDEKKVASFEAAAPTDSAEEEAAPAEDAAPAADDASEAAAAPADGDDTPQPAEAPAADEAAAMSDNGPDETEPAPTDSADEEADDDKKNNSEDPVTASVTNELDNIDVQAPEEHAVVASAAPEGPQYAPVTITAGADIPGIQAGAQLPDTLAVANALLARKRAMGRTMGGDGEMHHVAQFSTVFPEERVLSKNDIDGNAEKIEGAVSLVAAGGIAAPAEVRYELYGLGEDVRPVKDSLAVFGADRGGIRYITPPVLTDLNGAVSLWTVDDDAAAATGSSPTKPALRVAAGAEVEVTVDAVPLILTFGNMGARAYPELVERHTKLGFIQHARFAETRILTRIGALSTQVTAAKALGAARDIFVQVETAAAAYRNRHRMDEKTPLRAIFPAWFKNALRADLVKQLPGDGMDETFALAESTINNWFSVRGINVTWTVDGETGQILGAQGAGALNSFPSTLIWYLFSEGTFLFLDGGTLDLGIVRDSTLNATNDYKIFFETFEAVAKVGIESLRVSSQLSIAGATTGTVAPTV